MSSKPTLGTSPLQVPPLQTIADNLSLWQKLNIPMDVPHLVLRMITGLTLPFTVVLVFLRYEPQHPELLFIQGGHVIWALLGFLFADRFTPTVFRFYMLVFGAYMPLSNMLYNHISGYTLSGQMLTIFVCFLGMLFLQKAWDYILLTIIIVGSVLLMSYAKVLPAYDLTIWIMMLSSLLAGCMVGLVRQLYLLQMVLTRDTLSKARDEALEASRLKSQFLANISHELRTPMNAIVGLSELLLHTSLNKEQQYDIQLIRESSEDLLDIVNDILDFSKIESNTITLHTTWFHLGRLLQRSLRPLMTIARQKDLSLRWELNPDVPLQLEGDPVRIRQILNNIVGNAIKFTKTGGVEVCVGVDQFMLDKVQLRFQVKDTGIGIPYHKQRSIFAAFVQGEGEMNRQFGGTGLGLSISSNLVEMMGGHLEVESKPGEGSTFSFSLQVGYEEDSLDVPVTPPPATLPPLSQEGSYTPLQILLAEDNPVNQTVARKALESVGHQVTAVFDGNEAYEEIQNGVFDVILMDLQMPRCDGLEATRNIRKWETQHDKTKTPIIALTAHASREEVQRCLDCGMDAHLAKPFRRQDLLTLIQQIKELHS